MNKYLITLLLLQLTASSYAQKNNKLFKGMYLQWGYNTEWYTKSNIHFNTSVNGVPHNYTIYKAKAHDRSDLDAITKKPLEVSIPQFNYRIGFYLNEKKTTAIELNFDHTKYIVAKDQKVRVKGNIGNTTFDKDTIFSPSEMSFEHTNGANFLQLNYVSQHVLKLKNNRPLFTFIWKAGAGILIPKTDITLSGKRIDNKFHIAGYCFGAESGGRWYFAKKWFLEGTAKTGFANYTNSLALDGGKINHNFGYIELIGTVGYDINF